MGMLVLTAEREDRIIIEHAGETLTLSLNEIRGNKARLGFVASRTFDITRQKVLQQQKLLQSPLSEELELAAA